MSGNVVAGRLALMGFPRSWVYVCNLYLHRSRRVPQKAYELLCWWRLSDHVSCQHTHALKLDVTLDKHANVQAELDVHKLVLLHSEHLCSPSGLPTPVLCTRKVAGLTLDEIESGWSKHAHFAMPPVMRTCNVCAMLKEPLMQKEPAHRDRGATLKLDPTTLVPAEMKLCSWLAQVRDLRDPSYDVLHRGAGPAARCHRDMQDARVLAEQVPHSASCQLRCCLCRPSLGLPGQGESMDLAMGRARSPSMPCMFMACINTTGVFQRFNGMSVLRIASIFYGIHFLRVSNTCYRAYARGDNPLRLLCHMQYYGASKNMGVAAKSRGFLKSRVQGLQILAADPYCFFL